MQPLTPCGHVQLRARKNLSPGCYWYVIITFLLFQYRCISELALGVDRALATRCAISCQLEDTAVLFSPSVNQRADLSWRGFETAPAPREIGSRKVPAQSRRSASWLRHVCSICFGLVIIFLPDIISMLAFLVLEARPG